MRAGAEVKSIEPRLSRQVRSPHCGLRRPLRKQRRYCRGLQQIRERVEKRTLSRILCSLRVASFPQGSG